MSSIRTVQDFARYPKRDGESNPEAADRLTRYALSSDMDYDPRLRTALLAAAQVYATLATVTHSGHRPW